MSALNLLVGLVAACCALIAPAIERHYERHRRLQRLGRPFYDDRDSLERFRRIICR
jgi:hypothetical protein